MERAFVTGSRKYGTPKADSDIDLVVLVSPADLLLLQKEADIECKPHIPRGNSDGGPMSDSLRFGKLNLIAVTWNQAFEAWKKGTEELLARTQERMAPIEREEAVALFKSLREKLAKERGIAEADYLK